MNSATPGPWLRDKSSGLNCDVRAANGRKVALTFGLSTASMRPKSKEHYAAYRAECDANAVLIAAAPCMLDACKWALWLLEQPELQSHFDGKWGDPIEVKSRLEKAIHKATEQ